MTSADRERLAILVHEVRSPVAALAAVAHAFPDRELESSARRQLASLALAACKAIERVVSDAAVTSLRLEPVDLGTLAREAAAAATLVGGRLEARVEPELPVVLADPLRVRQALDNLVANALAYAPPDAVVIRAAAANDVVLLSVTDSGGGISPEDQRRIFEPGTRLDRTRPGSGLGLAISRAIAEAHGGTLTVRSVPGEGTTFTFALPSRR